MSNDKPIYSYSSDGGMTLSSGLFLVGFLLLLGVACFFAANISGVIVGLILITTSCYTLFNTPQRTDFFNEFAIIHYFGYKKPITVMYENIKLIRPHTQHETRERIFIAEMRYKKPVKKFTWHCTDKEFEEMKYLLRGNRIKIAKE